MSKLQHRQHMRDGIQITPLATQQTLPAHSLLSGPLTPNHEKTCIIRKCPHITIFIFKEPTLLLPPQSDLFPWDESQHNTSRRNFKLDELSAA